MSAMGAIDTNEYWAGFGELVHSLHQQLSGRSPDESAAAFYNLAGIFAASNKRPEAEFLYLRAIDLWHKKYQLEFPFTFGSVKQLAERFFEKHSKEKSAASGVAADSQDDRPIAA